MYKHQLQVVEVSGPWGTDNVESHGIRWELTWQFVVSYRVKECVTRVSYFRVAHSYI